MVAYSSFPSNFKYNFILEVCSDNLQVHKEYTRASTAHSTVGYRVTFDIFHSVNIDWILSMPDSVPDAENTSISKTKITPFPELTILKRIHMEKEMATYSSIPNWKIPWMDEPGRLWSMRLRRVWHDWATHTHTHKHPEEISQYSLFWESALFGFDHIHFNFLIIVISSYVPCVFVFSHR